MSLEKIGIFGLDNAGKTSIIRSLKGQFESFFNNLPTTSIERHISDFLGQHIAIWDYPGQENYRKFQLDRNLHDIEQVDRAILVIDIQDSARINENIEFFINILEKFEAMKIKFCSIYLHKYDIEYEADIDSDFEFIFQRYKDALSDHLKKAQILHKFYRTSIKRPISIISAFSEPIFNDTEYKKPVEELMKNFAINWDLPEINLFTSKFFKIGSFFKNDSIENINSTEMLYYLKEIDDSNNIINDLEIQIEDITLHFSKFYIRVGVKEYPLYIVWKKSGKINVDLKNSLHILKETMSLLITPDIDPEPIYI